MGKLKPIVIDLRTLKDEAFDAINKAKGKKQDDAIMDLAVFLSVAELSGGKAGVPVAEKAIAKRVEDLYFQVLFEYMVRQGSLEAKYSSKGRILSMKSTPKGLLEAEKIIPSSKSSSRLKHR